MSKGIPVSTVSCIMRSALMLILLLSASACEKHEPIRIGYIGGLTGRVADLGIAGRDGVMLAVEEMNRKGGINGRQVVLLVRDDRQNTDTAVQGVKELISEGVAAIIGHMTSSMSIAAIPIVNESGILMISPTTSTNELTGRDDSFFRVYPSTAHVADRLARYMYTKKGLRKVTVLYDQGNRAYTESFYRKFRDTFETLGGAVFETITYTSAPATAFSELARKVPVQDSDGLVLLANAMDTAMITQHLRKEQNSIPVFTGEWSVTEEILEYGGRAVEGIQFFHTFDRNSTNPDFLSFRDTFIERFGHEPGFAASHAYDAANVIFHALTKNSNLAALKETILSLKTFPGLQGDLTFDDYGDVQREHILMTIHNGQFQRVN